MIDLRSALAALFRPEAWGCLQGQPGPAVVRPDHRREIEPLRRQIAFLTREILRMSALSDKLAALAAAQAATNESIAALSARIKASIDSGVASFDDLAQLDGIIAGAVANKAAIDAIDPLSPAPSAPDAPVAPAPETPAPAPGSGS